MNLLILSSSIVLQYTAAVLAVFQMRRAGNQIGWLLLATAILLMAVRRTITLAQAVSANDYTIINLQTETVALGISTLMVLGVYFIGTLLRQLRENQERLTHEKDEAVQESKLSQQQKIFFEKVISGLSANIAIINSTGEIVLVNDSWIQFAKENNHQPVTSFVGVNYLSVCSQANSNDCVEAKMMIQGIRSVLALEKDTYELIYPCHSPNEKRWFHCKVTLYSDEFMPYVIVSHVNITQQKLYEDALSALASTFSTAIGTELFDQVCRYLVEQLQVDYAFIAESTSIENKMSIRSICYQGRMLKTFDYELINTPCEIVMEDSMAVYEDNVQNTFPNDDMLTSMNIEAYIGIWLTNANGESIGLLALMKETPIKNTAAAKSLMQIFRQRVEKELERLLSEEHILRSEEHFRAVVENSPDFILFIDQDLTIQYINRIDECYKVDNVVGMKVLDFIVPESQATYATVIQETITNKTKNLIEITSVKDRHYLCRLVPITLPTGEDVALVIATDTTELKELNEQLIQSQKMEAVGVLAGGIAHDFNNIIMGILGYSELALGELDVNIPSYKYVQEVQKAGKHASDLTKQLLAFSRKEVIQPKLINVSEKIQSIQGILVSLVGDMIEIQLELDPETGNIEADPVQIDQILINLAVNAKDAMQQGGTLTIKTYNTIIKEFDQQKLNTIQPGTYVVMEVRDNGIGMEKDIVEKIFEPFFTTKDKSKGTGLGLSTVYGIVHQYNGAIDVTSKLNHGTVFRVYLPVVDLQLEIETQTRIQNPMQKHATVFVVEDDSAVREYLKYTLTSSGFTLYLSDSPQDAEKQFSLHMDEIDILLTDVLLPKKSGREMAEELLLLKPEMKVIFMSGYADDIFKAGEIADQNIRFLQKPFTKQDLLSILHDALA